MDVDQYRYDKLQEISDKMDRKLQDYKEQMVEVMHMHNEDIRSRFKEADIVIE